MKSVLVSYNIGNHSKSELVSECPKNCCYVTLDSFCSLCDECHLTKTKHYRRLLHYRLIF